MVPDTPEAETETVAMEVPVPPVTGLVPKLTETPGGVAAASITLSVKPLIPVTLMVEDAEPSGGMVREDGAAAMRKFGLETITVAVAEWLTGLLRPEASTVTL